MAQVVLVMLDGVRPDALERVPCPALTRLRARGAATLTAASLMPSVTLPCHMSIFHSVPPARHGVTTNDWQPMARPLPGLVDLARAAGKRCAFFYNWEPLRNLSSPGALHYAYFRDSSTQYDGDDETAEMAARLIVRDDYDFAFVYFGTVDTAGHYYGWMSNGYLAQLERVDGLLGRLIDALPEDATLLVQSDHGGHERTHGTDSPEDLTIPWIVAGPAIRAGYRIQSPVSLLDSAPTLARLLGVAPHPEWEGRVVEEIFGP